MRILMSADTVGGVWTYALELCAELSARGIGVVLATMGLRPNEAQRAQALSIPLVALHTSNYRLEWMDEPWDDLERAGDWLLDLAARERVDVIHLNGYAHAALSWQKPVVIVAHSCVYSWWRAVHRDSPPPSWERYRRMVERGLREASVVVAPTHAFLQQLQQNYMFHSPCHVIRNARTSNSFATSRVPGKQSLIFASGRLWDEAKNVLALEPAARELAWPIYVAGDTQSPDGRSIATKHLRCLGRLDEREMSGWLQRAAIFVHPARYEPFGLAVLEAAHAGCALVLSDIDTLRESWGGAAIFVNAEDSRQLHHALTDSIRNPAARERFGDAARRRAMTFSPAQMGAAYAELYRELLRHSAKERSVA
jgi:glycogen(starch) synthase